MAKYLDKTQEKWDELVEQWHNDETLEMSLPECLELDEVEYMRMIHGIDAPGLTAEEVAEEAVKRTRAAVVGLTMQECLAYGLGKK